MNTVTCQVCFHHCCLSEGQIGFCGGRKNSGGTVIPLNYGKCTAIVLDPIEKKPLFRFMPRSRILSVGSFGCNFYCPFCQNAEIARAREINTADGTMALLYKTPPGKYFHIPVKTIKPSELVELAKKYQVQGNIGIAYTYNEPLIGYEFVRDTARLIHAAGMKNVLVSNGSVELSVLEEVLPFIDAMNIDLKSYSESFYANVLKGNLNAVKNFISRAAELCHVEISTLIIPDKNDSLSEMENIASFIASLKNGKDIPLHINRFFPAYKMKNKAATSKETLYRLAARAKQQLNFVFVGNV